MAVVFWHQRDCKGVLRLFENVDVSHFVTLAQVIDQLITLREEFICAVCNCLINLNIKFLAQAQRRCFAREDEILEQNLDRTSKGQGFRTHIPPSLTDSEKMFRSPRSVPVALTRRRSGEAMMYWPTLRGRQSDSRQSFCFDEIDSEESDGRKCASLWMENRVLKRGLSHGHILFGTDFDTQNMNAGEAVINVRYPKYSSFFDDHGMVSDFRQLIDVYQMDHYSKHC
jgi:hypothetical protein